MHSNAIMTAPTAEKHRTSLSDDALGVCLYGDGAHR